MIPCTIAHCPATCVGNHTHALRLLVWFPTLVESRAAAAGIHTRLLRSDVWIPTASAWDSSAVERFLYRIARHLFEKDSAKKKVEDAVKNVNPQTIISVKRDRQGKREHYGPFAGAVGTHESERKV